LKSGHAGPSPAGVRALTTKGPSAAATDRHACNPCPPSFCLPASRNGRSGDSQGVLATASVAEPSARGPKRGHWYRITASRLLGKETSARGPHHPLFPRKGTRAGNHPGLDTDGPLPSASDPAKGPTAFSSQATQGERTPDEYRPQLAGPRAPLLTRGPCSRGDGICRANRLDKQRCEQEKRGTPSTKCSKQPWMEMPLRSRKMP
jgi:hypothetical protein